MAESHRVCGNLLELPLEQSLSKQARNPPPPSRPAGPSAVPSSSPCADAVAPTLVPQPHPRTSTVHPQLCSWGPRSLPPVHSKRQGPRVTARVPVPSASFDDSTRMLLPRNPPSLDCGLVTFSVRRAPTQFGTCPCHLLALPPVHFPPRCLSRNNGELNTFPPEFCDCPWHPFGVSTPPVCINLYQIYIHSCSLVSTLCPHCIDLGQFSTFSLAPGAAAPICQTNTCISLHKELCIDLAKLRAALRWRPRSHFTGVATEAGGFCSSAGCFREEERKMLTPGRDTTCPWALPPKESRA